MQSASEASKVNWEFGSEFHWPSFHVAANMPVFPGDSKLFGSGRDALRALIRWGVSERRWRRLYVPTYFCLEVVSAISSCEVDVRRYEDSPLWAAPHQPATPFESGDVFLLVNYFGLRDASALAQIDLGPAELVEDHTHDPWSDWARSSTASYCLASLRKTLPVPDGAVLWSPRAIPLPDSPSVTASSETPAVLKAAAMCLKRLYLDGHSIEKDFYRRLQLEAESLLDRSTISGASALSQSCLNTLPWQAWRSRRRENYDVFCESLGDLPNCRVLMPQSEEACPFALIMCFDEPQVRNHVRHELIAKRVYPAVHWPIPLDCPPTLRVAAELSQRLLSLPCDFRYDVTDLRRVVAAIRAALLKSIPSQSSNHHGATSS